MLLILVFSMCLCIFHFVTIVVQSHKIKIFVFQILGRLIRPKSLSAKDLLNEPELTNVAILDHSHHPGTNLIVVLLSLQYARFYKLLVNILKLF